MGWSFLAGLLVGSGLYATIKWMNDRKSRKRKEILECKDDCLFFSPHTVMVQCSKRQPVFCKTLSCPVCNFNKLLSLIKTVKSQLDVCVYLITSEELARALLLLFSKGVFIRIIGDKQMNDQAHNSKMCLFMKEHIPIKLVSTAEIMHNKFMIIDQKVLVTGSFNWTKQASTSNYESGVVIHNAKVVRKFNDYFNEIWLS